MSSTSYPQVLHRSSSPKTYPPPTTLAISQKKNLVIIGLRRLLDIFTTHGTENRGTRAHLSRALVTLKFDVHASLLRAVHTS